MIDLPSRTHIHRRMPKEAFYRHLSLPARLRDAFVHGVEAIYAEYDLTSSSLNLTSASDVREIIVLLFELRERDFEPKALEAVAHQNAHKLVFILSFEGEEQLALYRGGRLYRTPWRRADDAQLSARGRTLDEIWDSFAEQVALEGCDWLSPALGVDARLSLKAQAEKLASLISKTERKMQDEKQSKKKYELHTKCEELRRELAALKAQGASPSAGGE